MTGWRMHPEYAEGFETEMEGTSHRATSSEPYIAGWKAAERVKSLLRAHGFTEEAPGEFNLRLGDA